MAKVRLTKKEVNRLKKIKGNIKGDILKAFHEYILREKGEKGVKAVEKRLKELGWPFQFKEVSAFKWYPEALICLTHLVYLEVFNLDESKGFDLGYNSPLYSIVIKLLMQYFISVDRVAKEAPKFWQRYFDFGEMKCTKIDLRKQYTILCLYGFKKFHPLVYDYLRGYLAKAAEMTARGKNVKVEQTKSLYNNDPYDEFKITWQ